MDETDLLISALVYRSRGEATSRAWDAKEWKGNFCPVVVVVAISDCLAGLCFSRLTIIGRAFGKLRSKLLCARL